MAKKINEKSVKKFLKSYNTDPVTVVVEHGSAELELVINRLVSPSVLSAMVSLVADSVVSDGEYNPAVMDSAKWAAILCYVANFDTDLDDECFNRLCCCTEIRNAIHDVWDPTQATDFEVAAMDMVDHKLAEILSVQKRRLEEVTVKLDAATNYLINITETFKDVDNQTMIAAIEKLSSMDELSLGNAIIDIHDARKIDAK